MDIESSPSSRPARGPYRKSSVTREAILDAALQVFSQEGYHKGSLRTIAAVVGMTDAGMLHHFRSKNALLAAVLERNDEFAEDVFDFDKASGIAVLEEFVRSSGANTNRPGVVQLYTTLSAEATAESHPARPFFVERYRMMNTRIRNALEDVQRRGGLRSSVSPERGARSFVSQMDGIQLQWLLDPEHVDMGAEINAFYRTYLLADGIDPASLR